MKVSGKLLVLFAAVVGVDAAAVKAWWGKHPVVAAGVAVGWAAVIWLGTPALNAVRRLVEQGSDRLVTDVGQSLGRWLSRYERRYRAHVRNAHEYLNVVGQATTGRTNPALDDVYIDLAVDNRGRSGTNASLTPPVPSAKEKGFTLAAKLTASGSERAVLFVLGGQGSGKTTLLRRQAVIAARSGRGRGRGRRRLPVLLELRNHVTLITGDDAPKLATVIRESLPVDGLDEPEGWWEARLAKGRCLILLDGLDEVANGAGREAVVRWIATCVRTETGCDFVVTARPDAADAASLIPGIVVLETVPWTSSEATDYLVKWYQATERAVTSPRDVDRSAGLGDLLRRLADSPVLDALTTSPLLVNIIANVHQQRGVLPGSRVELYEEICDAALVRRALAKNLRPSVDGSGARRILENLALEMMNARASQLSRVEVLPVFRKCLPEDDREVRAEELLADAIADGMLVESSGGGISFPHQAFQQFLASARIADAEVLAGHVDDPWWRETILLFVQRPGRIDSIVKACLASGTASELVLAAACELDGAALAPGLASELEQALAAGFAADASREYRRAVAEVLAQRHFRESTTTEDGALIYRAVPADLYRLFMADTGNPAPDGALAEGLTADPVTGVWLEDVEPFIAWLNDLTNNTYRMPRLKELTEVRLAVPAWGRFHDQSYWLSTGPGKDAPIHVTTESVAKTLDRDAASKRSETPLTLPAWYDRAPGYWFVPGRGGPAIELEGGIPGLKRLVRQYTDVMERRVVLTPKLATGIRSSALTLAAAAQERDSAELAVRLCDMVLAVTVLQQRRERPELLEHLILARG